MDALVQKMTVTACVQNKGSHGFLQDPCFSLLCFSWVIVLAAKRRSPAGDGSDMKPRAPIPVLGAEREAASLTSTSAPF